jgi:CRP-like cAMP-binding protein
MIDPNNQQAYHFFKKSILALSNTPEELIHRLFSICKPVRYKKGDFFLMAGDVPEYVGFNLNGIFRLYYLGEDGNDLTKGFSTAGKFVISYSALVQKRPSFFNIEALVDTDVLQFNYHQWVHMMDEDIRWYPFVFKLLESVYIMKEMREKSFLLNSATDRYLEFQREYPNLENDVKLYHIASFIGVTPEALSRIRKKQKLI